MARSAQVRLVLVAIGALIGCGSVGTWACWPLARAVQPGQVVSIPSPANKPEVVDRTAWELTLWQPLTDAPVQAVAVALPLKLYSILTRDGKAIAAISAGDDQPLIYAKEGDVVQGVTIRAIDQRGVDLRSAAGDQRLELGR